MCVPSASESTTLPAVTKIQMVHDRVNKKMYTVDNSKFLNVEQGRCDVRELGEGGDEDHLFSNISFLQHGNQLNTEVTNIPFKLSCYD